MPLLGFPLVQIVGCESQAPKLWVVTLSEEGS